MPLIEKIALKPCPFCGGEAVLVAEPGDADETGPLAFVYCHKCGASTEREEYDADAIAAWNNRAALTAIMGEADGVRDVDLEAAGEYVKHGIIDHIMRTTAEAFARHAAAERARIVAWHKEQERCLAEAGKGYQGAGNHYEASRLFDMADAHKNAADAIERGEV